MKPRTTRLQRFWNIWLVLPEVVRLAVVIAFIILLAFLTT
jgi:hypothetical protein